MLEAAIGTITRQQPPPRLTVAGRTDAGVHATGQVAHVDLPVPLDERRLNRLLPDDVRVSSVTAAPSGFDARFSALSRRYSYRLTDAVADPLRRRDTVAVPRTLDAEAMQAAARPMLGLHDFAAFCRRPDHGTTLRTLLRLDVRRSGPLVLLDVEADAFCHAMVRSLVGALCTVGEGRRPAAWPAEVLAERIRTSETAPAHGLTLVEVRYPPPAGLAARAVATRRPR